MPVKWSRGIWNKIEHYSTTPLHTRQNFPCIIHGMYNIWVIENHNRIRVPDSAEKESSRASYVCTIWLKHWLVFVTFETLSQLANTYEPNKVMLHQIFSKGQHLREHELALRLLLIYVSITVRCTISVRTFQYRLATSGIALLVSCQLNIDCQN